MKQTLFERFEQACQTHGNKALFELPDSDSVSFNDAMLKTGKLATLLLELGVQPGDRVAAQVDKSVDAVLLYIAAARQCLSAAQCHGQGTEKRASCPVWRVVQEVER